MAIESILLFFLGVLSTAFVVVLLAPTFWRRAATLTRRRIEASVPLTVGEISAEKDRLRAEHAMEVRRLETSLKSAREKIVRLEAEISRKHETIRELTAELEARAGETDALDATISEMRAELDGRDEELRRLARELAEEDGKLQERGREVDRLGRMFDEASLEASSRQIALVAREAEIDNLKDEVAHVRARRKESEKRVAEAEEAMGSAHAELRGEKKRAATLERKLERLMATSSDLEEKLERRDREIARLRETMKGEGGPGPASTGAEQRLEDRLTVLLRENKRLKKQLASLGPASAEDDAALRARIADMAAQIVNIAATLDGSESPLNAILAAKPAEGGGDRPHPSLAERVRALREASSAE